ncbi:MAG TPA: hypothetical protein VHV99_22680, partial [Paraburkholderia sp.]|nr:hypothetical protein [Paraburkholderia sp.]
VFQDLTLGRHDLADPVHGEDVLGHLLAIDVDDAGRVGAGGRGWMGSRCYGRAVRPTPAGAAPSGAWNFATPRARAGGSGGIVLRGGGGAAEGVGSRTFNRFEA